MKILFVSSFVYRKNSSAAIRNNKLIEGLISNGHTVDIHTIRYDSEWTDAGLLENHMSKDVSINYSHYYSINKISKSNKFKKYVPGKVYKIIKNIVSFPDVDKNWLKEEIKLYDVYDLIISSSDTKTAHFVANRILKNQKNSSKWIQIWGDPWSSDINLDFLTKKVAFFFEKYFLKKASKILYVSELTALEYRRKFPRLAFKIDSIGRSYYKKCIVNSAAKSRDEIVFFYPGALNENRDITNFCKNIEEYNANNLKKIRLNICGHQSDNVLKKYRNYDSINFMGSKSIDEVCLLFHESDFLLFVDNGSDTSQIPGKLYDYYGTNLPIISLLSKNNIGLEKFISKDSRSFIVQKDNKVNFESIINDRRKIEVDEYYSPSSVASRLINGL